MKGTPLMLKALENEMHGQGPPEPPALLQVAQADAGELCPAVRSAGAGAVTLWLSAQAHQLCRNLSLMQLCSFCTCVGSAFRQRCAAESCPEGLFRYARLSL